MKFYSVNTFFHSVIACFTCAVLGDLILLRCIRNLLAPPFLVTLDSPKFVFRFPTIYKSVSVTQIFIFLNLSQVILIKQDPIPKISMSFWSVFKLNQV